MAVSPTFWIVALVMAAVALIFIAPPLLKNRHTGVLTTVAIALPVLAALLYFALGRPDSINTAEQQASAVEKHPAAAPRQQNQAGSIASLVDGLAAKLEQNPNDGKNWLLLARSYDHLNRREEAAAAYRRAAELGEIDTELAARLDNETPGSESGGAQIYGRVALSENAMQIVQATDTVFIFARPAGAAGAPLAVLRRPASELPIDFLLNDSQAMIAGNQLSNHTEVVVTAKISRSGNADEALQGLEAKSDTVVIAENKHINLLIE